MINFCTLFDSNYLTRGLALYESLSKVSSPFHLYVIAFDDNVYRYLKESEFPNLTPVSLLVFEDESLLKVKPSRTIAEYCWTCTSSAILFCIEQFNLPSCTYLDADMIFYADPQIIIDEMGSSSILLSEHRYSREYDQSTTNGKYCVQFMCFKNDDNGMTALRWWRDRCLEWCYARLEDGKFGDQKYLDDWLQRFRGVHVLQHLGGGVAPWNVQQYLPFDKEGQLMIVHKADKKTYPVIFFHFHGLKFFADGNVLFVGSLYYIEQQVKTFIYIPYTKSLLQLKSKIGDQIFDPNGARQNTPAKSGILLNYIIERIILVKRYPLALFSKKVWWFNKHMHYHSVQNLEYSKS